MCYGMGCRYENFYGECTKPYREPCPNEIDDKEWEMEEEDDSWTDEEELERKELEDQIFSELEEGDKKQVLWRVVQWKQKKRL